MKKKEKKRKEKKRKEKKRKRKRKKKFTHICFKMRANIN
jgi:hypothetical protein